MVTVVFPPAGADAPTTPAATPPRPAPTGRRRILLVDDDRAVASAIALELDAHDVIVASSGREAIEILRRDTAFDVVLCDLLMPGMSGMDVHRWVSQIDPDVGTRFVFMTGGAFTAAAAQFLASVANPCLEKPFSAAQLHALVSEPADVPPRADGA